MLSKADCSELFQKFFKLKVLNENYTIGLMSFNENQYYSGYSRVLPTVLQQHKLNPDLNYENIYHLQYLSINSFHQHGSSSSSSFVVSRPWMKWIQKKYLQQQGNNNSNPTVVTEEEKDCPYESLLQPETISTNQLSYWKLCFAPVIPSSSNRIQFQMNEINLISTLKENNSSSSEVIDIIIMKVTDSTAQVLVVCNFIGLITLECTDSLTGIINLSQQQSYHLYQPVIFFFSNLLSNHHYDIYSSNTATALPSAGNSLGRTFLGSFTTMKSLITTSDMSDSPENNRLLEDSIISTGNQKSVKSLSSQSFAEEMIFIMNNPSNKLNYGYQDVFSSLFYHSSSFFTQMKLIIHTPALMSWSQFLPELLSNLSLAEQYASNPSAVHMEKRCLKKVYQLLQSTVLMNCFQNSFFKNIYSNSSHYFIKSPIIELLLLFNYTKISHLYEDFSLYTIQALLFMIQDLMNSYFDWHSSEIIVNVSSRPMISSILSQLEEEILEEEEKNYITQQRKGTVGLLGLGGAEDDDQSSAYLLAKPSVAKANKRIGHLYKIITPKLRSKVSFLSNVLLFEISPLLSKEWNCLDDLMISAEDLVFFQHTLASLPLQFATKFINKIIILSPIPLLKDPNQLITTEKISIQYTRESSMSLLNLCADWLFQTDEEASEEFESLTNKVKKTMTEREVVVVCGFDQGCVLTDISVEINGTSTYSQSLPPQQQERPALNNNNQQQQGIALVNQRNYNQPQLPQQPEQSRSMGGYHKLIRQLCCGKEGRSPIIPHKIKPHVFQPSKNSLYRYSLIPPVASSTIGQHGSLFEGEMSQQHHHVSEEGYPEYGIIPFKPFTRGGGKRGAGAGEGGGLEVGLNENSLLSSQSKLPHGFSSSSSALIFSPKQLQEYFPHYPTILDQGKLLFQKTKFSSSSQNMIIPTSSHYLLKRHLYCLYLLVSSSAPLTLLTTEFPASLSNKDDLIGILQVVPILLDNSEEEKTLEKTWDYLKYMSSYSMNGGIPYLTDFFFMKIFEFYLQLMMNSIGQKLLKVPSTMIRSLLGYYLLTTAETPAAAGQGRNMSFEEERQQKELQIGQQLMSKKEFLKEMLRIGFTLQLLSEELSRETFA
jgi:hypothetical protein